MVQNDIYTLGIDIGSTTVKIAVLDQDNEVLFSDMKDILPISRRLYLIFLVVPFINLVPSTSLRSSPDLAD